MFSESVICVLFLCLRDNRHCLKDFLRDLRIAAWGMYRMQRGWYIVCNLRDVRNAWSVTWRICRTQLEKSVVECSLKVLGRTALGICGEQLEGCKSAAWETYIWKAAWQIYAMQFEGCKNYNFKNVNCATWRMCCVKFESCVQCSLRDERFTECRRKFQYPPANNGRNNTHPLPPSPFPLPFPKLATAT